MIVIEVVQQSFDNLMARVNAFVTRSPRQMQARTRQRIERAKADLLKAVQTPPPPSRSPVDWETPRQMRAYFASNGFGGGIPSQRSGKLLSSFDIAVLDEREDSAVLVLVNEDPKARYVIGRDQQRMHARTGWPRIEAQVDDLTAESGNLIVDTWYSMVDDL